MRSINDWVVDSKCRGKEVDTYFPRGVGKNVPRTLCEGCPVIKDCKAYAVAHFEKGIWGGTSHHERVNMDPYLIILVRQEFRQFRLLEVRDHVPQEFQELETELLREHTDPNALRAACQAAIVSRSLAMLGMRTG